MTHFRQISDKFAINRRINTEKSFGKSIVTDDVVEDLKQRLDNSPKKSLNKLAALLN